MGIDANSLRIHGFVLKLAPSEESRLYARFKEFYERPNNLRIGVDLHLSLLICCLPWEKVSLVTKELEEWKCDIGSVKVGFDKPTKGSSKEYIFLPIKSDQLYAAHVKLIEKLKPFLKDAFNPKYLSTDLTELQREYLHTYGYHRVREFFNPHVTIGKYENETIRDEEFQYAPSVSWSFLFDNLIFDESILDKILDYKTLWRTKLI